MATETVTIANVQEELCKIYKDLNPIVEGDTVQLDSLKIKIRPAIYKAEDTVLLMGFFVSSPLWASEIVENCGAVGRTPKDALGSVLAAFSFGVMDSIIKMCANKGGVSLKSAYNGHEHHWKVYFGNIVSIGTRMDLKLNTYWDAIKDKIAERLGNQKLAAVKIYVANTGKGQIEGECRINNIKVDDLSEEIVKLAKEWKVDTFTSHKQYFMIRQDKDTILPTPMSEKKIFDLTGELVKLYEKCNNGGKMDSFPSQVDALVGDSSLVAEMMGFIPDLCAERRFDFLKFGDTISIQRGNKEIEVYKTQLYSYAPIMNGLFAAFDGNILEDTNQMFNAFVSISSLNSALQKAEKDGVNIHNLGTLGMMYSMPSNYILR